MTVYWVVWDAAAHWVVDRLDAAGALPALRRLRAAGVRAAARPPHPNCQTPPGLATLFTGTGTEEHGVTGFTVPVPPFGAHGNGFAPDVLRRPPVWRTLGRPAAFVHVPWVFDADGRVESTVDAAIDAYRDRRSRHDAVLVEAGMRPDWGVDVTPTAAGVRLAGRHGTHELTPARDWAPVRLTDDTGFWARCLAGPRGRVLVRTGIWAARAAGRNRALVEHLGKAPVFAGEGVGSLYRAGWFGPRLADGGDGTAERVFVSSVGCVAAAFTGAADAVLAGHDADLVVIYLPMTDDVGHELLGWCDPRSAAHRPDLADAAWALLARVYRWSDDVLGRVLDRAAAADTVLLGADHGMVGVTHQVHVNELLVGAGLAVRGPAGLDAAASAVIYHPANNGSLWRNPDLDRPGALAAAQAAIRTLGEPVRGFVEDHDGLPYLVLADDYQPSAALDGGPVVRPVPKTGAHVVNTGDPRLHATFAAAGPGLPAGVDLGELPNTVGARLVLHTLGDAARPEELG